MDLLIYGTDVLSFVKNFQFYSIFFTYGVDVLKERVRAVILFAVVVFSAIFLVL